MPNRKTLPLTKAEIRTAENLPDIPAIKRIKIDMRANKYKKIGK